MVPTLSVIVPVYNTGKYIEKCVLSLLGQTFRDYEIILVDDGSTDGSAEICDRFAAEYGFISVIHQENGGVVKTRKNGFSASKGKYISYIDSDDTIEPQMYESMMGKIKEFDADVCICGLIIEDEKQVIYHYSSIKPGIYDKAALLKDFYPKMLFDAETNNPAISPSLGNKIMRREILEKNIMAVNEIVAYGEDALCTYPCLLDAERVCVANNEFYYHYRQLHTSISHIYVEKLLYKFNYLIEGLDAAFSERGYSAKDQLACYAAKHSLECIRKELLYNKKAGIGQRIRIVKDYLNKPIIKYSFQNADTQSFDKSHKLKISLASKNRVFPLYILYFINNIILKIRGY